MKLLHQLSIACAVFGLAALAQDVMSFNQNTLGFSPVMGPFGKRATCSGTCASCYGTGNILCGSSSCYNPSAGETCCSTYGYACQSGYFCPSSGSTQQCCKNVSSAQSRPVVQLSFNLRRNFPAVASMCLQELPNLICHFPGTLLQHL
jgi:hypothetical protein